MIIIIAATILAIMIILQMWKQDRELLRQTEMERRWHCGAMCRQNNVISSIMMINHDDDDVDDDVDDYSYMTMMIMLKIWGRVCYQLQEGRRRLLLVPNFLACR